MHPALDFLIGLVCAFLGGELFVRGVLGISAWAKIPKAVTAATLAAFATSSPEISVAVNASLDGKTPIAIGDALGSNIVNVALILGLVLIIGPLNFEWKPNRREFLVAFLVPLIILATLLDGYLARWEAAILLTLFVIWIAVVCREALRQRQSTDENVYWKRGLKSVLLGLAGLGLLVIAGEYIVSGASGLGKLAGMDDFLIGVTLVAFGTSAPELATAVIAKLRGHDEVGVGTILGSNIFNCLFIVGLAVIIGPCAENVKTVLPSVLFGMLALACLAPIRGPLLNRRRGILLLGVYAASIVFAWWIGPGGH